jgi:hypothetical protein
MTDQGIQKGLKELDALPQLFANVVSTQSAPMIGAVTIVVKKFSSDDEFVNRIISAGLVQSVLKGAIAVKDDDLFWKIYPFVRAISRVGYISDLEVLLPQAVEHIQGGFKLGLGALRYLEFMTRFPEGVAKVKETNAVNVLVERTKSFSAEMKDLAERIMGILIR